MPILRLALAILLPLAFGSVCAQGLPSNRDPDAARLVTDDIPRFWEAFDALPAARDAEADAGIFDSRYLQRGSPGLDGFTRLRIGDAQRLAATVRAHPAYYAAIRANSLRVAEYEPRIRAALRALAARYPEAVFPDVYFLIGRMNSGGTLTDRELLIGVEMMAIDETTPLDELGPWERSVVGGIERVPCYVAHELMHYQQRYDGERTLLVQAFMEGAADFVAELVAGCHLNHAVHDWALPREAELWREFRTAMHGADHTGWLYGGNASRERPADLGYFIGYRIAQTYYAQAEDKDAALARIFVPGDVPALLEASGYGKGWE